MGQRHEELFSKAMVEYNKYKLLNNQGDFFAYCTKKKMQWYVKKGIGKQINAETVQLLFESKVATLDNTKLVECIVCGEEPEVKCHIVPHDYKESISRHKIKLPKYFDNVVLTCTDCNSEYCSYLGELRKKLILELKPDLHIIASNGMHLVKPNDFCDIQNEIELKDFMKSYYASIDLLKYDRQMKNKKLDPNEYEERKNDCIEKISRYLKGK